jgi:PAS domain S-box-containing protein
MEGTSTTPPAVNRFGIGARMAALVCAMVALTCIAGGVWTYFNLSKRLVEQEFGRQQGVIEAAATQLIAGVEALSSDAAFLTDVLAIQGIIRSHSAGGVDPLGKLPEEVWEDRLVSIFEAKMRATAPYFQVRLIGQADGGREVVRVERIDGQIVVTPDDKLQPKGDRLYFQEGLRVPAGRVYLSDIDLNREWGQVSLPATPVLRAVSPVYLPGGQVFGAVVINKDMGLGFRRIEEILAGRYSLFLFNEQGNLLMRSTPQQGYVMPAASPQRLAERFPQAREMLASPDGGHAVVHDKSTGEGVVATLKVWHYDRERPGRYYGLLLTSSYDAAISLAVADRSRTVWFGLLLLAVTVGTVLVASRKITRPLGEITAAVQTFAGGGKELRLPLDAGDEAGVLARAFDALFREVRSREAELEAEVSERSRTEVALRASENQLRLALSAARAGIWEWDIATDQTTWDASVESMAAIDRETFRGTLADWIGLMHPDDAGNVPEAKRRAVEENQPYAVEFRIRGREGDWRHWMARGHLLGGRGQPLKLVGIAWDVTEARLAQQQIQQYATELERKNHEMEQFMYSVSHDLKSPVVTFKGFLGILNEDLQAGKIDEALASARRLGNATQRMSSLIEDLLQFSRVGRGTERPETVDVAALVRELAEEELDHYGADGVQIDIQGDMPQIVADPTSVSRLFQNLLENAFKYGRSGPQPRIEAGGGIVGEQIHFYVRDNGTGIPKEYQSKIFGLFQRLDSSQEGTGIGLAIVSKIMEVHGGRAWVESDQGQGAAFWLAFPARFLAAQPPPVGTRSLA